MGCLPCGAAHSLQQGHHILTSMANTCTLHRHARKGLTLYHRNALQGIHEAQFVIGPSRLLRVVSHASFR